MKLTNLLSLLLICILSFTFIEAKPKQKEKPVPCRTRQCCQKGKTKWCWCSVKCGWRKVEKEDPLLYVEDDPNEIHCYCAPRDIRLFNENCADQFEAELPEDALENAEINS